MGCHLDDKILKFSRPKKSCWSKDTILHSSKTVENYLTKYERSEHRTETEQFSNADSARSAASADQPHLGSNATC